MLIFPPYGTAPTDLITPSEARDLLAGVKSMDPLDPAAYLVSNEQVDRANDEIFRALASSQLLGLVETAVGGFRRIPATWVEAHRSFVEVREDNQWRVEERVARLPDTVGQRAGRPVPDDVEGRPWYLSRAAIEALSHTRKPNGGGAKANRAPHPSSLEQADAPLLAEMRSLIESGAASSPHNAALAVADQAEGASLDAKIARLRKRYRKTFPS